MLYRRFTAVVLVVGLYVVAGHAGDWPQFRGPNGNGTSDDATLPTEWGKDKNVAWKVAVPGYGWSSPVITGDKIIVTTAITDKQDKPRPFDMGGFGGFGGPGGKKDFPKGGFPKGGFPKGGFGKGGFGGGKPPDVVYRFEVICLDRATGKTIWKKTAVERKPGIAKFQSNTYASETPVTDGERIYAYFGMHGLYCFDLGGKQLWKKDFGSHSMAMGYGTGSSPVLADGRLFVQCDNEEKSFLIALDAKTGDEVWKVNRSGKSSWCTPFVWNTKERTEIVACGAGKVISYDPATGKVLWELGGITGTFNSSPAANEERIYFGNGGPMADGRLFAVKAGASGDITPKRGETSSAGAVWARPRSGPYVASPLVYEGYVYVLDRGVVSCFKADTGEPAYTKERLDGARGFTSSPWAAGGKVYFLDEDGKTFVVKAGPQFELLGRNRLDEMFWSSPAAAGGMLFLRGVDNLYCIKP